MDGTLCLRAPELQAACRAGLRGYGSASREAERLALLTGACLERGGGERSAGSPPADAFDELARAILVHGEPGPEAVFVSEAEQASDVLCALWLARRSGLFRPGSSTADGSGKRSLVELVPRFAGRVSGERVAGEWARLYSNAAFRRHLEARGRARVTALAAAA